MIMIIYFVVGSFRGTFSSVNMLICWNAEGVLAHLSEYWKGTWSEKGWEPLPYTVSWWDRRKCRHSRTTTNRF